MAHWFHEIEGVIVNHEDSPIADKDYKEGWDAIPTKQRSELKNGILLSKIMVRCALSGMQTWNKCLKAEGSAEEMKLACEVHDGLSKYFHLKHQPLDKRVSGAVARGITRVFLNIEEGLATETEISLKSFPGKYWGGVSPVSDAKNPGTKASPIREIFGFADEYGHVDWKGLGGPVMFSTAWLKRPPASDKVSKTEEIARTLVHEASHRFAHTKDILYKDSSAGSSIKVEDNELSMMDIDDGWRMARKDMMARAGALSMEGRTAMPSKPKIFLTGGPKPLMSINPKSEMPAIAAEQWLENADSYAYFARRVWKRMGSPKR